MTSDTAASEKLIPPEIIPPGDLPPLREIRPGRFSACHFAEEVIDA